MEWRQWRPHYERIVAELGLDAGADGRAARRLAALLPADRTVGLAALSQRIKGRVPVVLGNGPGLARLLPRLGLIADGGPLSVVAAGAATARVLHAGVTPDVVVTDLDGDVAAQQEAARRGALSCIAAHGDNEAELARWLPVWPGPVLPTCQGAPSGPLVNAGGFTDGDRALFLLEAAGAPRVVLVGFDFRHPVPATASKQRKLDVARRLMAELKVPVEVFNPVP